MILLTILAIILVLIAMVVLSVIGFGGSLIITLFGDLIVFVLVIVLIVKLIQYFTKKNK